MELGKGSSKFECSFLCHSIIFLLMFVIVIVVWLVFVDNLDSQQDVVESLVLQAVHLILNGRSDAPKFEAQPLHMLVSSYSIFLYSSRTSIIYQSLAYSILIVL